MTDQDLLTVKGAKKLIGAVKAEVGVSVLVLIPQKHERIVPEPVLFSMISKWKYPFYSIPDMISKKNVFV